MNLEIFNNIALSLDCQLDRIDSQNYYLADISGNDSIAALIKILDENSSAVVIPSIIELACEYGDKNQYGKVIEKLQECFNIEGIKIMPGIICSANNIWRVLVSGHIQESVDLCRFYSPCISCHLVMHIIRIKIAQELKIKNVISGEREMHSGKEKINQLALVLDFYNDIYKRAQINHHLPVRHISDSPEISEILKKYNVDAVHLNCLFSGNYYRKGSCELTMEKSQIENYVKNYLPTLLDSIGQQITLSCNMIK